MISRRAAMVMAAMLTMWLVAAVPAAAQDTPWEPWTPRREVSEDGRHYVVLQEEKNGGTRVLLVERREGARAVEPLVLSLEEKSAGESIEPAAGDSVLASFAVALVPVDVRALRGGRGVLLFETWGALGSGSVLTLYGPEGKRRWTRTLSEIFDEETLGTFTSSRGSTWWAEGWWLDEAAGHAVLVARGHRLVTVSLSDGTCAASGPGALVSAVGRGRESRRIQALDLALEFPAADLPEALAKAAAAIVEAANEPVGVRLRAALCVEATGGGAPDPAPFLSALENQDDPLSRAYAARHIGRILGEKAIPVLRNLLRSEADLSWRPALAAFADIGPPAIPVLLEMMGEEDEHLDYRGAAMLVLGTLGAKDALPALWKQVGEPDVEGDENHFLALSALRAVVAINPEDLDKRLDSLLRGGTPLDGDIAMHYRRHPARTVAGGLLAAMGKRDKWRWERLQIVKALIACTGEDHGNDPEAWRKALAEGD